MAGDEFHQFDRQAVLEYIRAKGGAVSAYDARVYVMTPQEWCGVLIELAEEGAGVLEPQEYRVRLMEFKLLE